MATAELREMTKEAGLEGEGLSAFLRDERARQREREKEEREREKEEREREEKEADRRREREKVDREREEKEADRRHELELIQLKSDVNAGGQLEQAIPTRGFNGAVPKFPLSTNEPTT